MTEFEKDSAPPIQTSEPLEKRIEFLESDQKTAAQEKKKLESRLHDLEGMLQNKGEDSAQPETNKPQEVVPAQDYPLVPKEAEGVDQNDPPDWCADAVKRVEDGSDGLWFRLPALGIACNPLTTCGASLLLFGFVIFCAAQTLSETCFTTEVDASKLQTIVKTSMCHLPSIELIWWKTWVSNIFTWLYISTNDIWVVFAVVLWFSKYGKIKLGPDDEPPEFSTYSWFAMIFSCGVASGLFFYSVAEPIWHYEPCGSAKPAGGGYWEGKCTGGGNRYSHLPDNRRAQESINLTLYHWGLHGWVCYAIVGALLALMHFRKGLPMTMKSCFWPLLGDRIFGFAGDCLDIVAIVGTTFGVCTSLGLAVMQMNDSIQRRNGQNHWIGLGHYGIDNYADWKDSVGSYKEIWDMASPSYQADNPFYDDAGTLQMGTAIKLANLVKNNEQEILLIWIITGFSTLSLMVGMEYGIQTLGNFTFLLGLFLLWAILMMDDTWYILNLFVQSIGHYIQWIVQTGFYTGAFDMPEHAAPDGKQEYAGWMNDWTIFYWGWWIAWTPLVGTFIARISKGRTIREFMNGTVFGSTLFNFLWMIIYGGAGLKMEMAAAKAGLTCSAPTKNVCRVVDVDRYSQEPHYICSTLSRLSCFSSTIMMPALFEQYSDIGIMLALIGTFACFMYFVASSDSGSLVDSMLACNGVRDPPRIQRLYWSLTEGAAAAALLYTGRFTPQAKDAGLKALRAVSIAVGLPWTFLICFMCLALWRACQYECGDRKWGTGFRLSIVDFGVTVVNPGPSSGRLLNCHKGKFDLAQFGNFILNLVFPTRSIFAIANKAKAKKPNARWMNPKLLAFLATLLFYSWFLLVCLDNIPVEEGGYWTKGSVHTNSTQKISTRYGIFHGWPAPVENGTVIKTRANETAAWKPVGLKYYPDHLESMPVGDRIGTGMRIAVFGWFAYFLFVAIVTYLRAEVREILNKPGNVLEDFSVAFVLYPTVLSQVQDALESDTPAKDIAPPSYCEEPAKVEI